MRRLSLDYQRNEKRVGWLGLGLLFLGLLAATEIASQYLALSGEVTRLEARNALSERTAKRRLPAPKVRGDSAQTALQVRQANDVLAQLATPWDNLFRAVESVDSQAVALLAIEPDLQRSQVRISGEAKDYESVLAYVRYLGDKPAFTDVFLQSHQTQQQRPERPIRFALTATWTERK